MTGEMKTARFLYLMGLAPSDGRDGHFFNNARLIFNKAALFIDNAALLALIFLL